MSPPSSPDKITSLDEAYERIVAWYRAHIDEIMRRPDADSDYARASQLLIGNLPAPSEASELEKRAVMAEVIAGLLEWGYSESDGFLAMHEYAHHATLPFKTYSLSDDEREQLRASSRLWPYLNGGRKEIVFQGGSYQFSPGAGAVLREARMLAERSKRKGITSSCILFALADQAVPQKGTAWFVRETLIRNGNYEKAFSEFLSDSSGASRAGENEVAGLGKVSRNTLSILDEAASIAVRVCRGQSEIHTRHLFAALLVVPGADGVPAARRRLARVEIDLTKLRLDFREFLRTGSDDQAEWDAILIVISAHDPSEPDTAPAPKPATSPYMAGTPGYTSEYCGVGGTAPIADHLGVESLAHRLAELMALRETKLPLAMGLFGNWGSGKSHFMNLMDRHMKSLANQTKSEPPGATPPSPWCSEIVPIYFNAWHYSDTNLWASLVTEIFDGLFAHLRPKTDELELMRSRLRDADGVTARAEEEVDEAREAVRQATASLANARAAQEGAQQFFRYLTNGLRTLLPELNTTEQRKQLTELLGVNADDATLSQLIEKRREISSLGGRIKELWKRATARKGLSARLAWLLGALVAFALARLAAAVIPQLQAWLKPWSEAALAALGAFATWITPVYTQLNSAIGQMEGWEKRAEAAQTALAADPRMVEAQRKLDQAEARARAAESKLAEMKDAEKQLTSAIDDLRPERRLTRFIDGRARSADYRGQLGLVSLARRDFQELSDIFADTEALQHRIDEQPEDKERFQKLSAAVDRIVLFVDDLDRCEPEKVVDVLQAVHLLLAYPLFGVVVGVDQRCLKQSLRLRFKGLLTPARRNSSGAKELTPDEDELPATPLDYLEKIFHVPFHLPPMDGHGFATFVEKLTDTPAPTPVLEVKSVAAQAAGPSSASAVPPPGDRPNTVAVPAVPTAAPTGSSQVSEPPAPRVVGTVPLHRWERDALKDYHQLIRTPRGATRLLNTYRLVRAGVPAEEWDSFRGDEGGKREFRVAMLLLAVAAGQPAVAREWFGLLRTDPLLAADVHGASSADWTVFKKLHSENAGKAGFILTNELLDKWLNRVERFAF